MTNLATLARMPRQVAPPQSLSFQNFPHGLNTVRPARQIQRTELSSAVNIDFEKGGQPVSRDPIKPYTTTATTSNSAVKVIEQVKIGATLYTLIQDAAYKIYYLDSAPKPVYVAGLTSACQILAFNGAAMLMDGSYLKYMDDVSSIKIAYDNGTGDTAYQYNNTCGSDDDSTAMYSGSVTMVGSKVTTLSWDTGYTIPLTEIEAWLSKTGSPTGTISAKIYNSDGSSLLGTATETMSAADLTTNATKHSFSFGTPYSMAKTTAYIFAVEYTGGDVSNTVNAHCSTVASGGKQYQYDGSWSNVAAKDPLIGVKPGRPPKASFGAIADLNLILAGDPDNPGYMWVGNKTYKDFSTTDGGGYVGAVDDNKNNYPIGGIASLYNDTYVYGTEDQPYLCKLTGTSMADYKLPMTFQKSWSTSKTLINAVNDIWVGARDGIDTLSGVQEYGDVRTFSASDAISDRLIDYWNSSTTYAAYRAKTGQYLLAMAGYHRVLVLHTKTPSQDPYGQGTRYPASEHEYYLFNLNASGYKWTKSASGTNEYYCTTTADGDPGFNVEPDFIVLDGEVCTVGTMGSLAHHEVDYGDNDTLGFSTVYFRDDSSDPDTSGVIIKTVMFPTAMKQVGSYFLLGGSDGFIYEANPGGYLDQDSIQIEPRMSGVEADIPYGTANFNEMHILASSESGGILSESLYKNGGATATVTKSFDINISAAPLHKPVNLNARSIKWEIKGTTLAAKTYITGTLLKYRMLSY